MRLSGNIRNRAVLLGLVCHTIFSGSVGATGSQTLFEGKNGERYRQLKSQYETDKGVFTAFERANADLPDFLQRMLGEAGLHSHSLEWQVHFRQSVDEAQKDHWSESSKEANLALKEEPALPDAVLMQAIANKKMGNDGESLDSLLLLLGMRRKVSQGRWNFVVHNPDEHPPYRSYSMVLEELSKNVQNEQPIQK